MRQILENDLIDYMKKIYLTLFLALGLLSTVTAQCGDLFFSEYVEGSSSNKALEIYNPTGATVNLTDYVVYRYNNGSLTAVDSLFPQGTIATDDVFIIGNPSANASILGQSDTTHTITFYNGDDAILLINTSTGDTLDAIGEVGVDPGTGWPVATGATNNFTLIRMIAVQDGETNWAIGATQWDVFPIDNVDSLGTHSMMPCMSMPTGPGCSDDIFFSEYIEGSSSNKALEIYNPMDTAVDLTNYVIYRFNNGSTSATDSLFPQGMVASDDVFVIGNPSANATILGQTDTTHTMTFYNGDDAILLINLSTGDTLDAIGEVGVDPGSGWMVGTGATNNFTLIRKFNIRMGNTDWTTGQGEWDVFPIDMADSLGMHSMNPCGTMPTVPEVQFVTSSLSFSETAGMVSFDVAISNPDMVNPTSVDIVLTGGSATAGMDFTFTSPTTVTFPAASAANQTVTALVITDDNDLEGTEDVLLNLQNPTNNAVLGSNSGLQVNILDDEVAPAPTYPIGTINTVDTAGVGDSLAVECFIGGIVYGVNLRPSGLQFTMIDSTGGISVFSFSQTSGYVVQEGDSILLRGTVAQFNGLLQMAPDSILLISTGNTLVQPDVVTQLGENTESDLVVFENAYVIDANDWTGSGSGFNVDITNGTDTITLRVDADVDLYTFPAPLGRFNVCGLGGQFDNSSPYNSGYQLLPRYVLDMKLLLNVNLGNDTLFCGDSLVLNAGPTDYNVLWSTGDTTDMITVTTAGTYTVTLSDPGYNQSVSDTIVVDPNAVTAAAFNVDTLAPNAFQFIDQSTAATSWSWNFGDGMTSTMQSPFHTYTAVGVYNVTLLISSACGTDSTSFTIDLTVGLEEELAAQVQVSPNPSQGTFSIALPAGMLAPATLRMQDALGRLIWSTETLNNKVQVNREGLEAGIYFLEVEVNSIRTVKRISIQ